MFFTLGAKKIKHLWGTRRWKHSFVVLALSTRIFLLYFRIFLRYTTQVYRTLFFGEIMKIFVGFLFLGFSSIVFANHIILTPGSKVTLTPKTTTQVSCELSSSSAPICDNTVGTGNCDGLLVGTACTYYSSPGLVAKAGVCVQSGFNDGGRWCSCGPRWSSRKHWFIVFRIEYTKYSDIELNINRGNQMNLNKLILIPILIFYQFDS